MPSPNVLIFMADNQRGDTVLPEHPALTPNLDRFQREGLTFTQAYTPSPHCCPSRATFMTGLYPSRHGVWNNVCNDQALSRGLRPGVRCWSEHLRDAGYQLGFSGKWHVSVEESPRHRGFEEVGPVRNAACDAPAQGWPMYEKLAALSPPGSRSPGEIFRPGYGSKRIYGTLDRSTLGRASDEQVVQHAIDALPRLAGSDQPWAMYVGCQMPHDPYFAPAEYLDRYVLDDVPLPRSYADTLADKPAIVQRLRRQIWGQLSEREVREAIRHYWAMCTYLDDLFGQLLQALEATGQADDTLVLYVSDHGDYLGEHGVFAKGIPSFRGAYHIPAIMRWPGGISGPGRRDDAPVSLADFAPTFIELAGVQPDPDLTGRSLLPLLRNQRPPDWRDEMHTQCNGVELYYTQRSVTAEGFKYVFNGFDFDELYDLRRDPDEMVNLAHDQSYGPVKRRLCRRMWRFAHRQRDAAINAYITVGLAPYGPAEAFM